MKKQLLLLPSILLLIILGVGYAFSSMANSGKKSPTSTNSKQPIKKTRHDPPGLQSSNSRDAWRLQSRDKGQLRDEVVSWANRHFGSQTEIVGRIDPKVEEVVFPRLPLRFVKLLEFEVIPIPQGRRVPGYEKLNIPSFYAVAVLQDARGNLYDATVESYDPTKKSFTVQSVGPVLDRTPKALNLPIKERRLNAWPPANMAVRASSQRGKRVLIPYPYSMNQIFFQYGNNPSTATFESIHTGKVYKSLNAVLDKVDAEQQSLRIKR